MNRIDELIALAALGELDDAERRELDHEAAQDAEVAAALRDALETAAALQAGGAAAPPATLRNRVLDAIENVAQQPAGGPDRTTAGVAPVTSLDEHRRSRGRLLLAAAAVIGLIVGLGGLLANRSSNSDVVAAVLDADDVVARPLSGSLSGTVTVSHSASVDAVAVTATGLDPLAAGQTFQLWLVDDAGATSVGVFRPASDGTVRVRFDNVDPAGFVLGVTVEPSGGSDQPTLPIVLSA
jgi:anti-sigma-K factor RskA